MNYKNNTLLKAIVSVVIAIGCFYISFAFAQDDLGKMATGVQTAMQAFAGAVSTASYLGGLVFAVIAIIKFKAHKDAPTQVPISTPIVLLFVATGLLFLPGIFRAAGKTLGMEASEAGTISGTISI